MADIHIAVMGAARVGKTTLIQRALGLRAVPTAIASSARISVDRVEHTVSLVELALESCEVSGEGQIRWPTQMDGYTVPRLDGALLLYDVMSRESILELPQTLSRSARAACRGTAG